MKTITRQELKAKQDVGADIKLVMTVGGWTYRTRHIPGSVSYPSPSWALRELCQDDDIILYSTDHHRQDPVAAFDALTAHATSAATWVGWPTGRPPAIRWRVKVLARPPGVGPTGTAPTAESCTAAVRTVTTAGRAPAGHRHQPEILDGATTSNPKRRRLSPHWLRRIPGGLADGRPRCADSIGINAMIEAFWSRMQVELLDGTAGTPVFSWPTPSLSTWRSSTVDRTRPARVSNQATETSQRTISTQRRSEAA